jgi:hypothetical protein
VFSCKDVYYLLFYYALLALATLGNSTQTESGLFGPGYTSVGKMINISIDLAFRLKRPIALTCRLRLKVEFIVTSVERESKLYHLGHGSVCSGITTDRQVLLFKHFWPGCDKLVCWIIPALAKHEK